MLVQPSFAERPFAKMTICALKISAARFSLRRNVPASAPFVGNEGEVEPRADTFHEFSIPVNGCETVVRGMGRFVEGAESLRKGVGSDWEMKRGNGCWKGN